MSLQWGPDHDEHDRVQWKTREPRRPRAWGQPDGWLLQKLLRPKRRRIWGWPTEQDVIAGFALAVIVAIVWVLAVAVGG